MEAEYAASNLATGAAGAPNLANRICQICVWF
jgi:hypothetical protein